jgi:hypothetical protein
LVQEKFQGEKACDDDDDDSSSSSGDDDDNDSSSNNNKNFNIIIIIISLKNAGCYIGLRWLTPSFLNYTALMINTIA